MTLQSKAQKISLIRVYYFSSSALDGREESTTPGLRFERGMTHCVIEMDRRSLNRLVVDVAENDAARHNLACHQRCRAAGEYRERPGICENQKTPKHYIF